MDLSKVRRVGKRSHILATRIIDSLSIVRVRDSYNGGQDLLEFVEAFDLNAEDVVKEIELELPTNLVSKIANEMCNHVEGMAESLDDTISETVEHSPCTWEQALEIICKYLKPEQQEALIQDISDIWFLPDSDVDF